MSTQWDQETVGLAERQEKTGCKGGVVWFTGLSGAGKTTLARRLDRRLLDRGRLTFILDGDVVRSGLNADLGFSGADREENLRRITQVARLMADAGVLVLTAVIAPYEEARVRARELVGADRFVLVHVATPIEVCEDRDVKGLYARARAGELKQFTGIDSPYEQPETADIRVGSDGSDPPQITEQIIALLEERSLVRKIAAR